MNFPHRWAAATTALALIAAGPASAQDVVLAHDKAFWDAGWNAIGAEAGFTATTYPTDQYIAYIQSSIAAGSGPGLFTWWTGSALEDVVSSGAVAPVDDIWDAAVAAGDFPEGLRPLFSVGDTAYAIPVNVARWVVLYNKDMFEQAGLSEPTTWEEFEAALETLKAAGITPINATVQDGWRGFVWFQELMIRTNPEAYAALHTGELPYNSPEVKEVFDIWVDWASKGYFSDPRSTTEAADFAGGNAAMFLAGEWAIGGIAEAGMNIDEDLGVFIMPNRDASLPAQVIVEGAPLMLSASATEADRAAYSFWATPEAAQIWSTSAGLFNGNAKVPAPNAIVAEVSEEMAANGTVAVQRWWEAVPSDIRGDLVAELSAFVLNPTADQAQTAMDTMEAVNSDYWANQ